MTGAGPDPRPGGAGAPAGPAASLIGPVRASLELTAEDEARLRAAGPRLLGEVEGWVERFYARLVQDPTATPLLVDDATVLRLKRSLVGWAHEMLQLPFDAAYEGARVEIGRVHVRIGMPIQLMVTAMGNLRRDVVASVDRLWGADAEGARGVRAAVEKALDLELALMLAQYERRRLEMERDRSRAEDLVRLARRFERIAEDTVAAALCHSHLARTEPDGEARAARLDALEVSLRALLGAVRRMAPPDDVPEPTRPVAVPALLAAAFAEVSLPAHTDVGVRVEPPGLEVTVRPGPVVRALVELLQNAANHDPGGRLRVEARAVDGGGALLEVSDGGPGWPPHVRSVADVVAGRSGMGLSVVEDVVEGHGGGVELFPAPTGGAGVRLRFPPPAGGAP